MKIALVSMGIVVGIVGLLLVFFVFTKQPATQTGPTGTIPFPTSGNTQGNTTNTTPSGTVDTGGMGLTVAANGGGTMVVRDFMKDKDTYKDPANAGQQYLGYHFQEDPTDTSASENPPYVIDYFTQGGYFNIVLYQEPLGAIRQQAQQDLMQRVGLSQVQMCNLKYTISAPNSVNQAYAGVNLLFSFCPGATVLP